MSVRLNKIIKEFNVGLQTVVDALTKQGYDVKASPSEKIDDEQYEFLRREFGADKDLRNAAEQLFQKKEKKEEKPVEAANEEIVETTVPESLRPQIVSKGVIKLDENNNPVKEENESEFPAKKQEVPAVEEPAAGTVVSQPETKAEKKHTKEGKPAKVSEAPATVNNQPETDEEVAAKVEKPAETSEDVSVVEANVTETDDDVQDIVEDKPGETKKKKQKLSVEERAKQMLSEEDGVFKLKSQPELAGPKVLGTIDLTSINSSMRPKKKSKEERKKEREEKARQNSAAAPERKKRNRIGQQRVDVNAEARKVEKNAGRPDNAASNAPAAGGNGKKNKKGNKKQAAIKPEVSDEDVAKQVRETLARLQGKSKASKGAKYRKEKRDMARQQYENQLLEEEAESKVLKLTEFVTANELATMMDVPVTKVIGTCMSIGVMVSINQRMDAETIDLVAEEFGFRTEFVSSEVSEAVAEEADNEEDLIPRAPIVTVMGHVDHGKTSLLDYIRKANVIAGEAGGITQHIGAYNVTLEDGRHITFLDTPGHEAFTAMRARGAQVTDIAIIIIASDDDIMPQTKEAINHAVAANVPIVFAINKVDKPSANPDKIKEGLANMNFLVEEWGGKYQSQDISAKKGIGVNELLEKVLLEADMLELKANPNRRATGTVIESSLDKGRGYVATVLVSNGTLHQGDVILAGTNYGRVRALFNERNQRIQEIGPSQAAAVLGFNGAPQAGDAFHVMETEQEAREIANKREQLQREQNLRTTKMLTLDEVGRRIKLGSFQELNIIVKGDVDGSVEALSDSFIKLSTETIAVNVIHKSVGQISENDVTLAAASQAIICGFQVRPSQAARRQAERDGVDIRTYSVIYDAIDEVKQAMEGMLQPILKEEVTATVEVRQVYHISKVGMVAGAYVIDGKVSRSDKARLIRDGIVVFTGNLLALKRFKDDVKEVSTNFECGISLAGCNDIREGDMIETFREIEVKQKL